MLDATTTLNRALLDKDVADRRVQRPQRLHVGSASAPLPVEDVDPPGLAQQQVAGGPGRPAAR
jgi:hypothetical protein